MQNELTAERIEKAVDSIEQHKDRMEMFVALAAEPEKTYKDTILYCDALVTALAALRAEQDRLNPQPLTVQEMNELNEEPVYIMHVDTIKNGAKTWLAYRTKPEGSAE